MNVKNKLLFTSLTVLTIIACSTDDKVHPSVTEQAARTQKGQVQTQPSPTEYTPTIETPGIFQIGSSCLVGKGNTKDVVGYIVDTAIDSSSNCKSDKKANFFLFCKNQDPVFGEQEVPQKGKSFDTQIVLEDNKVERNLPQSFTTNQNGIGSLIYEQKLNEKLTKIILKIPANTLEFNESSNFNLSLGKCGGGK